jgi:hypothetical protein
MLGGGLVLDGLAWAGAIAANEPPLILHLSILAIIIEGFNGVQIASDNKKGGEDNGENPGTDCG